jgi:autotransporter-associated beta strand protein
MNTFMRHQAAGLAQCGRGLACLAVAVAVAMLAAEPAAAQTTWSATPASGLWNLGSNWASGTAPAASGTLAFGTSTITTTTNNFAAGTRFDGITFLAGAPAYTLSGSSFALGGNVTNNSTNLQTFRLNMTAVSSASRTFTMTAGGGDIELAGSYDAIGFNLSGTGTLILSGSLRGANANAITINADTTLRVASPGSLPQSGDGANGLTRFGGGTLDLRNDVGQDFSAARLAWSSGTNFFINVDRAVGGTGSNQTMTIGNLTKSNNSNTNFIVTGSNGYGLTTGTLTFGNNGNGNSQAITNNAPGQLIVAGYGFNPGTFGNYNTLTLGGTGGSMSIGGLRSDNQSVSASGTFGNGSYSVVKSNTITASITGPSNYAGTTTVQAGTLRSTANAGLGGAGIARELSRAIGTVTVTGSAAASAVDFSGVTANNVIALSGSTFGASLLNSNAAAATTLDNGVAGITFTNGGSGFTLANLNADGVISVSSGGAAAQITSLGGSLGTVTITNGGSGYAIGNYIQLTGGNATNNANLYITYQVSGTGAGGSITAVSLFRAGNGYTGLPTAFTTGTGISSGATVGTVAGTGLALSYNDNFAVAGIRTTSLGTDYTTAPTITTTSGSGLVATANVSSVSLTGTNNSIGGAGAMTIKSAISGASAGFAKVSAGRLTLSASNSYTGATRISEGILEIGSTGRINGSSGITIAGATAEFKYNSATALTRPITFTQGTISGTGSINTAVTVGTNNVISPGNSPGIQAYTSLHAWASGGTYEWELNALTGTPGTAWDLVNVSSGTFNLSALNATPGNQFTLDLITLDALNAAGSLAVPYDGGSYTFAIASYNPTNLVLPTGFSNTPSADLTSLFAINLGNWQGVKPQISDISVRINSTATGIDLVIVPEPGSLALVGIGIAAAAWALRSRSPSRQRAG